MDPMINTPQSLLFIDGGDPAETLKANELLKTKMPQWNIGIQGQTTNPTLVVKNPDVQAYIASGKKLSSDEALKMYRTIVENVAKVTNGPISIQVIADESTSVDSMLAQARVYKQWIPNYVIKFPAISAGIAAAQTFCQEGPVNITLNFSLPQAAAVYSATMNAKFDVFISPFVGRIDDQGENGMELIKQEMKLYEPGDQHVKVLTASLRSLDHLLCALKYKSHAITIPFKVFQLWADANFALPPESFNYSRPDLKPLPEPSLVLGEDWKSFDLAHPLTSTGIANFMKDWKSITSE